MMKKVILALFLIGIVCNVFAEAGPPIPKPSISLSEASKLVMDYFRAHTIDDGYFKIEDYFVTSGEYKSFEDIDTKLEDWAWEIKIIHPVANDISATYKITNSKQIIELEATE